MILPKVPSENYIFGEREKVIVLDFSNKKYDLVFTHECVLLYILISR